MGWIEYYDKAWALRAKVFESLLDQETALARVLARFDRFEAERTFCIQDGEARYLPASGPSDPLSRLESFEHGVSCGQVTPVSPYAELNVGRMLADLAEGADLIAEIGSGYGRQLFNIWLAGGATPKTRFIGFEPNEAGRQTGERLAALVPAMTVSFRPGDFATADLSDLAGAGRVLLFTHFSVMFPESFPADFFHRVQALGGEILLVFVEPLGWQMDRENTLVPGTILNKDFMRRFHQAAADGLIEPLYVGRDLFGRAETMTQVSVTVATTLPTA
jgi:hypothetical protein